VRIGVLILPEHHWAAAAERWSKAESLGFAHAWTYDHIAWRGLRDSTWFASVPTLAGAATVTSTIRLGTLVASPNFRHPVPFAREVVTLDDLSRGRLTLGLGAGGHGWDATVLGNERWTLAERQHRFEEFVELLDRLLTNPSTSFTGRYWSAQEAPSQPGCVQRPRVPFAIAAAGPRALRVAARYADVWVTNGDRDHDGSSLGAAEGAAEARRHLERFVDACDVEGRDPATVDKLVLTGSRLNSGLDSVDSFDAVVEAYAAAGFTDLVVHWPRPTEPYAGDDAILEGIAPGRRQAAEVAAPRPGSAGSTGGITTTGQGA
jgi:alkanesulfonate monooxygenase SsuD/methylene tetrahydromethanopterin reductase-like flavin-dependent oxidoreductase (luciferase family)